jgi:hypothetical protein
MDNIQSLLLLGSSAILLTVNLSFLFKQDQVKLARKNHKKLPV